MGVLGYAQGAAWEPLGSELVADVAAGSLVLPVDNADQFDDDDNGGSVLLNGTVYTYSAGAIDEDAATITLDTVTDAAATTGDAVTAVSGGQPMIDLVLHVSLGDGDDVEVVVPFNDRDLWPEGEYDEPVRVVLSNDQERIEDVPGRMPARDQSYSYAPRCWSYLPSDIAIPNDNPWTNITTWFSPFVDQMEYDAVNGRFVALVTGTYAVKFGATFASNSTGSRGVRMRYWGVDGTDLGPSRAIKIPADGTTAIETNQERGMYAGMAVSFEVYQNSGGTLNLRGVNAFVTAATTEVSARWVTPL